MVFTASFINVLSQFGFTSATFVLTRDTDGAQFRIPVKVQNPVTLAKRNAAQAYAIASLQDYLAWRQTVDDEDATNQRFIRFKDLAGLVGTTPAHLADVFRDKQDVIVNWLQGQV